MYTSTEQKFFGLKIIVKVVKDKENNVIKIVHIKICSKSKENIVKIGPKYQNIKVTELIHKRICFIGKSYKHLLYKLCS